MEKNDLTDFFLCLFYSCPLCRRFGVSGRDEFKELPVVPPSSCAGKKTFLSLSGDIIIMINLRNSAGSKLRYSLWTPLCSRHISPPLSFLNN